MRRSRSLTVVVVASAGAAMVAALVMVVVVVGARPPGARPSGDDGATTRQPPIPAVTPTAGPSLEPQAGLPPARGRLVTGPPTPPATPLSHPHPPAPPTGQGSLSRGDRGVPDIAPRDRGRDGTGGGPTGGSTHEQFPSKPFPRDEPGGRGIPDSSGHGDPSDPGESVFPSAPDASLEGRQPAEGKRSRITAPTSPPPTTPPTTPPARTSTPEPEPEKAPAEPAPAPAPTSAASRSR